VNGQSAGASVRETTPPALPIQTLPVTAQLVNSNGTCWSSTFGSAQRNDAAQFKATSD